LLPIAAQVGEGKHGLSASDRGNAADVSPARSFIIDACQSTSIVEEAGFRPGPLGGHGIGQLACDKGVKVLASARAYDLAWESKKIRQGLTAFALIQEGLLGRRTH